jgi:hypothetical protein
MLCTPDINFFTIHPTLADIMLIVSAQQMSIKNHYLITSVKVIDFGKQKILTAKNLPVYS